ncbi:sulfate permease [Cryobacterium frigoriphilum]|uniref:sulfate permease n=1 Tax=Cryobacterium frigoriphilum TaxID=1259150 RepID=UPI00157FD488|nr:sulfate permease [Cryobacterium frigoriphilum]
MFGLILGFTARSYYFLRGLMPTTRLVDAMRTRRGLKWGVPAMLLAVPYLFAAFYCSVQVQADGPGWLHLLVLLFLWNAMKFAVNGPVSLIRLLVARWREARMRRQAILVVPERQLMSPFAAEDEQRAVLPMRR